MAVCRNTGLTTELTVYGRNTGLTTELTVYGRNTGLTTELTVYGRNTGLTTELTVYGRNTGLTIELTVYVHCRWGAYLTSRGGVDGGGGAVSLPAIDTVSRGSALNAGGRQ